MAPTKPITDEEHSHRQYEIDTARTSIRLEGFVLDEASEALFAHYIKGKLTHLERSAAVQGLAATMTG